MTGMSGQVILLHIGLDSGAENIKWIVILDTIVEGKGVCPDLTPVWVLPVPLTQWKSFSSFYGNIEISQWNSLWKLGKCNVQRLNCSSLHEYQLLHPQMYIRLKLWEDL